MVQKHEGKGLLGRNRRRLKDNTQKIGYERVNRTDAPKADSC